VKNFLEKHRFAVKWLSIALLIKSVLFIFFAYSFCKYWPSHWNEGLFNASGDTSVYYGAVESFYNGNGYDTYCRMPGLLPVYYPIRLFFSAVVTKNIIIILQLLAGVVSIYVLAKTAKLIFNSQRVFFITFFIYAFSSFVSIWDHVGYADSFGTSFLIYSIYLLVLNKEKRNWKFILFSGLFMTWSIFFRPVHGIIVPLALLVYLCNIKDIAGSIKRSFVFALPLVFFLGVWTYSNYSKYKKVIVLQGSLSDCFSGLTEDLLSIRELIVAWGGDSQPWAKNSEGEWFFGINKDKQPEPAHGIYTSAYNLDSLKILRSNYFIVHSDTTAQQVKDSLRPIIVSASNRYRESYKKEHASRYYFLNKVKLLKKFLIPGRLDDLPLPASDKMNLFQKAVKGGYFLLLIFINVFGMIGCFLALKKKTLLPLIPLSLLIVLCPVMGLIEQRYLVPVYSFFVVFSAYVLEKIFLFFSRKKGV
jgi:hypothetical protein